MPDTKPDLQFDEEGVCSACRSFERRVEVDWDARKRELTAVLERYRSLDGSNYDCLIPVSGGKDSTYQTLQMLDLGMHPLCVTATTDHLSEIGRQNIDNLKHLGVDYVEVTLNPIVRRKMAVQAGVPLIIWGENPQNEYGGPAAVAEDNTLTRRWLEEFGGLLGLRVSDLASQAGIEQKDLIQYTYPSDEVLRAHNVTGIFLGYYLPWDGYQNALIAQAYGFRTFDRTVEGSLVNYENLDNLQTGIHDYFKFLKFGFARATDLACMHIRRGRLSREEGIRLVRRHDGRFPWTYLGHPVEEILAQIEMSLEQFVRICDRFTNKKLFACDASGNLIKDELGNLRKVNYDNE
jgi:tRNA(Ile)-lysidine synthase TilS/MesJ